jgi:glycyl-tRNA synthetase beta chain
MDLLSFFADRLKQYLKDEGEPHDLIDAVFSKSPSHDGKGDRPPASQAAPAEAPRAVSANDDLVLITKRVAALGKFLDTEDGTNLLAGYKRATNILKAEAKKTGETYTGSVNPDLLSEKPEQDLHSSLTTARAKVAEALTTEDFEQAMAAMAPLRGVLDTFFDNVTVNADDTAVRQNRLLLLASMRDALADVADFSRIEG